MIAVRLKTLCRVHFPILTLEERCSQGIPATLCTTPQLVQLVKVLHRNSECGGSANSNPAWGFILIWPVHTQFTMLFLLKSDPRGIRTLDP